MLLLWTSLSIFWGSWIRKVLMSASNIRNFAISGNTVWGTSMRRSGSISGISSCSSSPVHNRSWLAPQPLPTRSNFRRKRSPKTRTSLVRWRSTTFSSRPLPLSKRFFLPSLLVMSKLSYWNTRLKYCLAHLLLSLFQTCALPQFTLLIRIQLPQDFEPRINQISRNIAS